MRAFGNGHKAHHRTTLANEQPMTKKQYREQVAQVKAAIIATLAEVIVLIKEQEDSNDEIPKRNHIRGFGTSITRER